MSQFIAVFVLLGLAACGSSKQTIHVTTEPSGAKIYINGESIGTSNRDVTFDFAAAERNTVQVVLYGYHTEHDFFTAATLPKDGRLNYELREVR